MRNLEEFAGSEKLGLAPKVLQILRFCMRVLQQAFNYVRPSTKVPQNSEEEGGARTRLLRTSLLLLESFFF